MHLNALIQHYISTKTHQMEALIRGVRDAHVIREIRKGNVSQIVNC